MRKNKKILIAWLSFFFILCSIILFSKISYEKNQEIYRSDYCYRILIDKKDYDEIGIATESKQKSDVNEKAENFYDKDELFYEKTDYGCSPKISSNGLKIIDVFSAKYIPNQNNFIGVAVLVGEISLDNFEKVIEKIHNYKITFVLPHYLDNLSTICNSIRKSGHEFMLQIPTQNTIIEHKKNCVAPFLANMKDDEFKNKFFSLISSVKYLIGIVNTSPSLITKSEKDMNNILMELNNRGIGFLNFESDVDQIFLDKKSLYWNIKYDFSKKDEILNLKLENKDTIAINIKNIDELLKVIKDEKFDIAPISFFIKNK